MQLTRSACRAAVLRCSSAVLLSLTLPHPQLQQLRHARAMVLSPLATFETLNPPPRMDGWGHVKLDWVTDLGLPDTEFYTPLLGSWITTMNSCTCQYCTSVWGGLHTQLCCCQEDHCTMSSVLAFSPHLLPLDPKTVSFLAYILLQGMWEAATAVGGGQREETQVR